MENKSKPNKGGRSTNLSKTIRVKGYVGGILFRISKFEFSNLNSQISNYIRKILS